MSATSSGGATNERNLRWDQSAQLKLLKLVLSDKLGCTPAEVEARVEQLATLLPDMLTRMETTRADILQPLLADLPGLTIQLIGLRECLPGVNLSQLVAKHPRLLNDFKDPASLAQRLDTLRAALPGVNGERLQWFLGPRLVCPGGHAHLGPLAIELRVVDPWFETTAHIVA
ncbi:hypothetical protein TSOC_013748, partial [Tetrabaena socialis]